MNKLFAFDAPAFEIVKSYRDDSGQMFIEGIAATTGIDLTGERMSSEVIAKMAARLVGKPLRSEHGKGWDDKIGVIQQADVRADELGQPALWIKARLNDWSSKARDLFSLLKDSGAKMGLSVAGKINPGGLVREMVDSIGKYIPTYRDVEPTEVSVTDHPANLGTFAYAVSKSLHLAADDVYDPDEFNKSDRPATIEDLANLAKAVQSEFKKAEQARKCDQCGEQLDEAGKCAKCDQQYDAAYAKGEQDNVMLFLDTDNNRYPADDKHLMPLLRYFNNDGRRDADGYQEDQWGHMGKTLAQRLTHLTGDSYEYNQKSEKVVKEGVQKNDDEKEVITDMNNNKHGNLVSKTIPQDVKGLLKSWGKDPEVEEAKMKADEVQKTEMQKGSAPELFTPGGSSSSDSSGSSSSGSSDGSSSGSGSSSSGSSSSDSSDSSSGSSSSSSSGMSSELSSLMSDLKSTLEAMKDSLSGSDSSSGSSSSSSDSSGSSSSGGSSDSSSGSSDGSSTSDKTSTDKALDASLTSSESSATTTPTEAKKTADVDEVARAIDTLVQAANTMREALAKNKKANGDQHQKDKGAKPSLAAQSSEEASDMSGSGNASDVSASSTAKALEQMATVLGQIEKSLAKRDEEFSKLVEKSQDETPNRKGYAWTLEKKFDGYHDAAGVDGVDADTLQKIKDDKSVTFEEYYKYKHYGQLPKKYMTKS